MNLVRPLKPLPFELVSYVGEYLCKLDLANLSLACKTYRNILKCALFRRVVVSDVQTTFAASLRDSVLEEYGLKASTRHLTLRHREGISSTSEPDALYKTLELFPRLTSLKLDIHDKKEEEYQNQEFSGFTKTLDDLRAFVKYLAAAEMPPSLEHIQFKVYSEWPDEFESFDDLPFLPPVKSLHIEWDTDTREETVYLQFAQKILGLSHETLTRFSLQAQAPFTSMTRLFPILSSLQNLTDLNLCGPALQINSPFDTPDEVIPHLSFLTKLESLRLGCQFADADPGFLASVIPPMEDLCKSCLKLTTCVMADYLTGWLHRDYADCPFIIHRMAERIRITIEYDASWMPDFPGLCLALGSSLTGWEEEEEESQGGHRSDHETEEERTLQDAPAAPEVEETNNEEGYEDEDEDEEFARAMDMTFEELEEAEFSPNVAEAVARLLLHTILLATRVYDSDLDSSSSISDSDSSSSSDDSLWDELYLSNI